MKLNSGLISRRKMCETGGAVLLSEVKRAGEYSAEEGHKGGKSLWRIIIPAPKNMSHNTTICENQLPIG